MAAAPQRPGTAPPKAPAPTYLLPPDFAEFSDRAGYHAEADGRVYTLDGSKKSYVPPWVVWQNSQTGKTPDGQLTPEGLPYRTPGSDPSSAWRWMYEKSGPFRKGSQWDDKEGTYKGSVDWGTLLGTIAAGGLIAGGVAASIGGGSAAGGGGVGTLSGSTPVLEGVAAGPGAASTAAGLSAPALAGEAGVTTGLGGAALPGALATPALASSTIAPTAAALAPAVAPSGAVAAAAPTAAAGAGGASILSKTLGALTTPAVLSTIAQGAFGAYGASQAAGAQTDAAKIIADANTAAAKIQADAATQAAQLQAKGTADALAFAKQGYADQSARYEQNQEQLSPYTGAGGAAVTKLSQLLGLGTPAPYVSAVKAPAAPVGVQPQTGVQSMARPGTAAQQSAADAFVPNAVQSNPALSAVPQGPGPNAGTISSLAPAGGQMVTLRAPTGEMAQKPAAEAQHWISLGAQPVQQGAAV